MGKIAVYVERSTIASSFEMDSLMRFALVARRLGHWVDFLFRPDMYKIPEYDAVFIRALTDPLNSAYVAARLAEMHGVTVIDDPASIRICCDKIYMYSRLMRAGIPMPETVFLTESELTERRGRQLFEQLGNPLILKAPNSSFSMYVERAHTTGEFLKVGKRYFRRADRIVAQKYIPSDFDWRVGILGHEPLYACQYTIPRKRWKILTYTANGKAIHGPVRAVALSEADPQLIYCARQAAAAIGGGLYGVDLKQVDNQYYVLEVNDNPTIIAGDEDRKATDLYEKLVRFLLKDKGAV
jgi:glutathione synthase/RimK-type ligase-like ATP-grasp enzyme